MSTVVLPNTLHFPVNFNSYRPTGSTSTFTSKLPQSIVAQSPALFVLHEQLGKISRLPVNWDSHGSARPNLLAIEAARQFVEDTYHQTQKLSAIGWQRPHISASEDGEVVFEWWNGNRKLTIYVGPHELTYIKSWGPNVISDMEDGIVPDDGLPSLWGWLFG